mgnify:CR=1 FL=1
MTRTELLKRLFAEQDLKYRDFHTALLPGIDKKTFIGVRVPTLRNLAQEFVKNASPAELQKFLQSLPHRYFEENQIHLFIVEKIRDFQTCLQQVEAFLPYIDNWAVCDGKSPKALLKDAARFEAKVLEWLKSEKAYTVRFAVNMLMAFFLDERFDEKYLKCVAAVDENRFESADRYYVQMVVAWFFATALAKQWNATLPYIQKKKLSLWIHAKAIQKACESFRITAEGKVLLRSLK